MNLIIDIGNSVAKLAIFDKGELVEVFRGSNHSLDCLPMLCSRYPLKRGIIASVITLSNTIRHQLERLPFNIIELSHETPVPVTNLYKTPQTLGMDRLAAVVAANWLKPGHDVLVIDAGKPENMQGFHEDNMLFIVDEASGVADPIMEAIFLQECVCVSRH